MWAIAEWGNTAFAALQPDFAELVSTRMSHVFVSPMHPTADTGQARCFSPTRFSGTSFHLADLWYGEQQCAPDGQHFVAINCCAAWDNHGYGLSLFAAKPALRVVETYDLAAMGKEAFWSPNSKLFCVLAEGTGYVCSVPGRQTYPAHMRELPASPLIDCFWSPCSTLIAAGCTQQSRLIIWRKGWGGAEQDPNCRPPGCLVQPLALDHFRQPALHGVQQGVPGHCQARQ